jgi:hypothetical protein
MVTFIMIVVQTATENGNAISRRSTDIADHQHACLISVKPQPSLLAYFLSKFSVFLFQATIQIQLISLLNSNCLTWGAQNVDSEDASLLECGAKYNMIQHTAKMEAESSSKRLAFSNKYGAISQKICAFGKPCGWKEPHRTVSEQSTELSTFLNCSSWGDTKLTAQRRPFRYAARRII